MSECSLSSLISAPWATKCSLSWHWLLLVQAPTAREVFSKTDCIPRMPMPDSGWQSWASLHLAVSAVLPCGREALSYAFSVNVPFERQ